MPAGRRDVEHGDGAVIRECPRVRGTLRQNGGTEPQAVRPVGWWEHLTDEDRALLGDVGRRVGASIEAMRADDAVLASVLAQPEVFDAVWDRGRGLAEPGDPVPAGTVSVAAAAVSPFLVFATAIHRGWADVQEASHVTEWVGLRQRLPVFGGEDLRSFLASAQHRFFLAALLGSFTRVASGSTWVHTARGWRRRRFSELDPVRLAGLLEVVPPFERPGIFRRLGDVALFLTGVFPDRTESHGFGPVDEGRLLRAGGVGAAQHADWQGGAVELLERLGQRWYRAACRTAPHATAAMAEVADIADCFVVARRVLNLVTDRYLFPVRGPWFGEPAA